MLSWVGGVLAIGLAIWTAEEIDSPEQKDNRLRLWMVSILGGFFGWMFFFGAMIDNRVIPVSEETIWNVTIVTFLACVFLAFCLTHLVWLILRVARFLAHDTVWRMK
jgi:hypothetical protein